MKQIKQAGKVVMGTGIGSAAGFLTGAAITVAFFSSYRNLSAVGAAAITMWVVPFCTAAGACLGASNVLVKQGIFHCRGPVLAAGSLAAGSLAVVAATSAVSLKLNQGKSF